MLIDEVSRPMIGMSKGFTPKKRAEFVKRMNEQGVVCMDEDGVPQTGRGIIRRS